MKSLNLKENSSYYALSLAIFGYLVQLGLAYLFNQIGLRNTDLDGLIFYFLYVVLFLLSCLFNKNLILKINRFSLIFVILFFSFIYGLFLSPDAFELDRTGFSLASLFLFYPSAMLMLLNISDYKKLLRLLCVFARILSILCILIFYINYSRRGSSGIYDYDMVLAYQSSLCVVFLLCSFFNKYNFVDLLLSLVLGALVLVFGNRGAFLVIIASFIINFFRKVFFGLRGWKKVFSFLLIIIFIIALSNVQILAKSLAELLSSYNIDSRSIVLFLDNSIVQDSGRNTILESLLEGWNNMPVFGYGLLGDRLFLDGSYSHNLFLEIFTDFGFLMGGGIILYFFFKIIGFLIKNKNDNFKIDIFLSIFSFAFVMLMFSDSFLTNIQFFVLLGLLFSWNSNSSHLRSKKI